MRVYRLSRKKHAGKLSGKGAALSGNRWNSKGVEMIYTSESRALAMAEVIVHLSLAVFPKDFVLLEIEIPDAITKKKLNLKELPEGWNAFPHHPATQQIGDAFIRDGQYAVLQVPSAVVNGDSNYLINPFHIDFEKISIQNATDFPFDNRIFKRITLA